MFEIVNHSKAGKNPANSLWFWGDGTKPNLQSFYDKFSKKVDACYVVSAVKSVMAVCPKGATVVVESTVSPGTIDKYVRPVIEENGFVIGKDIHLVHAPERIIPGNMVYELLHNNRTIGADDRAVGEKIKELYASFCLPR